MHAEEYTSIYGIISDEYPWGHAIWQGLKMEITEGMGRSWNGGPQHYSGLRARGGYFRAPAHFSKRDALQPYVDVCDHLSYPAVFVEVSEDVYIMWCLESSFDVQKGGGSTPAELSSGRTTISLITCFLVGPRQPSTRVIPAQMQHSQRPAFLFSMLWRCSDWQVSVA